VCSTRTVPCLHEEIIKQGFGTYVEVLADLHPRGGERGGVALERDETRAKKAAEQTARSRKTRHGCVRAEDWWVER